MTYDLSTFTRTTRRIPYMSVFYHGWRHLGYLPPGSVVILQDNEQLAQTTGPQLNGWGLQAAIQLGLGEAKFVNDGELDAYLARVQATLQAKQIDPLAIFPEEEWYTRPEPRTWAYFAGLDEVALKRKLRDRLGEIVARIRARWPQAYVVDVETRWNHDPHLWGARYYAPPIPGLHALGLSCYLSAFGTLYPDGATPGLTPFADQAMLDKFYLEVGRVYEYAAQYGPLMLVAQAFRHTAQGDQWSVAPTPDQLEWYYRLAQRVPQVASVAWFAVESMPGMQGLIDLPDRAVRVLELDRYNRELPNGR